LSVASSGSIEAGIVKYLTGAPKIGEIGKSATAYQIPISVTQYAAKPGMRILPSQFPRSAAPCGQVRRAGPTFKILTKSETFASPTLPTVAASVTNRQG
jgi:hypothetical protein